jgi:Na+-driven multidrug efflux pump
MQLKKETVEENNLQNSNLQKRFIQMTTVPISQLIVKLAIPTIISMLITAIYNMADTIL